MNHNQTLVQFGVFRAKYRLKETLHRNTSRMAAPLYNPAVPFTGFIQGGFLPGKMVRIQGSSLPSANRFAINLQCGPNTAPRDDIAFHLSPRFSENCIARNSLQNVNWGPEENYGHMPIMRGQYFEIIILCEAGQFKIAVNGQHFTEFPHRIPYQRVTYLTVDGDVTLSLIQYEGGEMSGMGYVPPPAMTPGFVPPLPTGAGPIPYPPAPTSYPTYPPASTASYPQAPGPVASYPQAPGPYPVAQGAPYGYQQQQPYAMGYPPPPPGYPPVPPGYVQGSSNKGVGGLLDKAGAAIGSVFGSKTGHHGGGHGGGHGMRPGMAAGLGGTALGAGLAGAALTGHLSPKKGMKNKKNLGKKALKYGLPIAGVGLGAYALKKGFHHGSSSSSSSSSSEEE